jgi:hypothetical protein
MSKKTYAEMTQEEREEESRKYIEGQKPIRREQPAELNKLGDNVPEPKPARRVEPEK